MVKNKHHDFELNTVDQIGRIHILMPMAGRGLRFANAGFRMPKPLIEIEGIPIFKKALSSLDPLGCRKRYTFIILKVHGDKYGLKDIIKRELPYANVMEIEEVTRGAVETCMRASHLFHPQEALLVLDCDFWFKSKSYLRMIKDSISGKEKLDGGLLCFESGSPRYSYAEVRNGFVVRTAEKKVISGYAIAGAYYFSKTSIFSEAATELLRRPINNGMPEYYISLLYNIMIENGYVVSASMVEEYRSFGTPEELAVHSL